MEVWPDNVPTIAVFIAMCTQWRVGMSGATGLDYAALPVVMRLNGIAAKDRPDVFEGIREMEDAALAKMHEGK